MLNIQSHISDFKPISYEANPPFGSVQIPSVLWFDISKSKIEPEKVHIENLSQIAISPFSSTLHYGQSIFEGMKAFRQTDDSVAVFRPDLHAARFSNSAKIMAMVDFTPELFLDCLMAYLKVVKDYVPREAGHSLYLRPLLFANDPIIKVKSSESYRFVLMSSIVGPYFSKTATGSKVLINKAFMRAFPGGTGEAKTSANYALSLKALEYAYSKGFDQVLYVDAIEKCRIEELGGMNFFMVKDNQLYTPKLDGQILHGVTRNSLLELASELNIKTNETEVLLTEITEKKCQEVFASGTAASISPIGEIGVQDNFNQEVDIYQFHDQTVAQKLLEFLIETQRGETKLSSKWLVKI